MSTREAAERWADVWEEAWPAADVQPIVALYAADVIFHTLPFREHRPPRDYVTEVFDDQAEAECRFGTPLVDEDRAAVDWWGVVTSRDGSVETIAGTSLLRFDADGLVVEQRDAWEAVPGRRELPGWAS